MPAAQGKFRASERDLLLSTVTKVGKSTGRNLRFLHLRRAIPCTRAAVLTTRPRGTSFFRAVKRIVSAPAPLPLIPITNNTICSTVDNVSGSGARGTGDASYATISTVFCNRVVKGHKFVMRVARRKSRNLGFWLSFWSLLGQRPKVTRPGGRNTPLFTLQTNTPSSHRVLSGTGWPGRPPDSSAAPDGPWRSRTP